MDVVGLLGYASTFLAKEDIKLEEPMSKHTSFHVGGPAKAFITVSDEMALEKLISYMNSYDIPFFILGNGSNLLVSDEGFDGVILSLGERFREIKVEDDVVKAGTAALLTRVSKAAMEAELEGLEFAAGIPGSLGGGVVMNAGAYGGEMSQVVLQVKAMDEKGRIFWLDKEELLLGYRSSIFKMKKYIALEAHIRLKKGKKEEILARMQEYNRLRREKQPLEYPSAGSTFKRPEGFFAGKLIMDAGLKGFSVGGAQVSQKHCGFVINTGNATTKDICCLMREVQKRVKEKFGVDLEPEVIFVGRKQ